jgi:hypothetical protein
MVAASKPAVTIFLMHENIQTEQHFKKTLDLRRQQVKKLIQGYFSWIRSFKTLITSRKVSIYCGITS